VQGDSADGVYIGEAHVTFTTIDVPGAMGTSVNGINTAGEMTGYYYTSTTASDIGFTYLGGSFNFFSYPGGSSTQAYGINDSGIVSGTAFTHQDTETVGFTYNGTDFTTVAERGVADTVVYGINNDGDLVGGDGSFGSNLALEFVGRRTKSVTPPGTYLNVAATGVNSLGEIVGATTGGVGQNNGYVDNGGKFRTIIAPKAAGQTLALGVNDGGIVIGWYIGGPGAVGFALSGSRYLSLTYPGAIYTLCEGINSAGQIVGSYSLDGETYQGFVTSPVTASDFGDLAGSE
jgi:probable HAF family extracellular repeat protein